MSEPARPITEHDLHAWVDGRLPHARRAAVEAYLAARPAEAARWEAFRGDAEALRRHHEAVLDEPLPPRLEPAAYAGGHAASASRWRARGGRIAAAVALAFVGAGAGWLARGQVDAPLIAAARTPAAVAAVSLPRRAAVAHAVFSPDARRPVEIGAEHEDQLVAWLSRRLETPLRVPHLGALGWRLVGGRLLPGAGGPVAQLMYEDEAASRLTLYVSREGTDATAPPPASSNAPGPSNPLASSVPPASSPPGASASPAVAFRFAREGDTDVFYWIDGPFGYAITAAAGRGELATVAMEVYRQLAGR